MNGTVLITGASSGIGHACARRFAIHGYNIIAVGRNSESLHALASELHDHGTSVKVLVKDLSDPKQVVELYDETRLDSVQVLINNAGFGQFGSFHETDLQTDLDMIAVNVSAVTTLTKLYLKDMLRDNSGAIINVCSTAAFQPTPLMNVYGATKAYVMSLTEAVASEVQGTNVHVMAVCPGSTDTHFHQRAGSERPANDTTKLMTADDVAIATYKGMLERKQIVIPGFTNKAIAQAHRFIPRRVMATMAKRMYMKRKRN